MDGEPQLNLASFVTTYMEEEAEKVRTQLQWLLLATVLMISKIAHDGEVRVDPCPLLRILTC